MKKLVHKSANNEQRTFVFSLNDKEDLEKLSWEGDDEFTFNGQMYDIITKKIENGKIVIRCIADEKETVLVNKLNDNCRENANSNKVVNALFLFLQTLFHNPKSEELTFNEPTRSNFAPLLERLQFQIKKILIPPPR